MVKFTTTILRFSEQGEKTGWTYIEIPADIAQKILPNNKRSFRVKGKIDAHTIKGVALMPMGGGNFIMPLNASMRKGIGKRKGATVTAQLELDDTPLAIDKDLMACMNDEPAAIKYFNSLPKSHQNYISNWIRSAKTEPTKTKRIAMAVSALSRNMGFVEMLREQKAKKDLL
ncbi:MAG TPA: YdeI/OmpD-associated family protein [Parafilimonas sp.]|nr:YdeI/OmpD-associated family protein [Parafilimonas sp.]